MARSNLEYLLLDLGNVFIYWNKDSFIDAIIDGLPSGKSYSSDYEDPFWLDLISYESKLEEGQIRWAQFCRAIEIRYGWKGCPENLLKFFQDIFKPNRELIEWFTTTDFTAKTILMSNTNAYHWKWISKHYDLLLSKFDHLHLSHEVGYRKPNLEFYESCRHHIEWTKALFVDDVKQNLIVPKKIGAEIHQFLDVEEFRRHLWRFTY